MKNPITHAITIPLTPLGAQLDETARIKRDMTILLQELEATATGRPVIKPGRWRHHPTTWQS